MGWNVKYKMNLMQSKKRRAKFLNALIFICLEFHPNFVDFLIVEAGEKIFVAFGQKGLRDLVLPPLNFFMPRFCDHLSSDPSLTP
jgi:hypothetical protein